MAFRKYILNLRKFRKLHKFIGTTLAVFLIVSSLTGVLLSLKKDVDIIQPATTKGISDDLSKWLSFEQVDSIARLALHTAYPNQKENQVDRFDVRPSKGIVKVLFKKGYWEVQIDGTNGSVKSIAKRHSDWIEALHDGSIINDLFKLISMNILGIGLFFLIISGLWLWYGPKRFRMLKKKHRENTVD